MKLLKNKLFVVLATLCVLLISGCGGGSSIDAGALEVKMADKPARTLEGFDVTVTAYALTTAPSVPVRYEVMLADPTKINDIQAFVGFDYQTAKVAVVDANANGNAQVWSVAVPKPLVAGSGLLLSLTSNEDGDLLETGPKDFVF